MSRHYFGTDGIRGRVGEMPITAEFVLKLGWAVGRVLAGEGNGSKVLVGKDTRISGYMFESALEAGLSAAGVNIHLLGPMPTPAIAYLTRTLRAQAGIVISASHNPYYDNGIKFFSAQGDKLPDALELAIEAQLEKPMVTVDSSRLGKASRVIDAAGRYIEFCKSTVDSHTHLRNLKIVVDCANGATYHIAPNVFRELGAEVLEMNVDPDGLNINENGGSTQPDFLKKRVLAENADLGIAFDGDGDRVIMVDHQGNLVDGDELLFIMTKNLVDQKKFEGGVVGTVMSNLGLERALKSMGIDFVRTKVGDRHVMEALRQRCWSLGGESSGHIIPLQSTTTGDGIISSLQVLSAMCRTHLTLRELASKMTKFPQTLINVKLKNNNIDILQEPKIQAALLDAEKQVSGFGRVLLRSSGTEPLARVMVEGENEIHVRSVAQQLALAVEQNS